MVNFVLEKAVWTESDFERMGWHDARIYAIDFTRLTTEFELAIDIDYIFEWQQTGENYSFWSAPCTLVFHECYDVIMELAISDTPSISDLTRSDPTRPRNAEHTGRDTEWTWRIDCPQGEVVLKASGYTQYVRRRPTFSASQWVPRDMRGPLFGRDLGP